MSEPELKTADTAKGRIGYREAGTGGTPLVCLHGLGGGARSWVHQLAHFSATRRVIAWDTPGYGGSADYPSRIPKPSDYADCLIALLDTLGISEPVDLVGHSMGGAIAPQVVARAPGRVRRLVLSATRIAFQRWEGYDERLKEHASMTAEEFGATRAKSMCSVDAPVAAKALVAEISSEIRATGYAAAVHMLSVSNNKAELRALDMPVLVLAGAEDRIAPEEYTAELTAIIPGAHREIIGQSAHAAYLEQPAAYNARLHAFLDT